MPGLFNSLDLPIITIMSFGTAPKFRSKKVVQLLKSRYAGDFINAIRIERAKEAEEMSGQFITNEPEITSIKVIRIGSYSKAVCVQEK